MIHATLFAGHEGRLRHDKLFYITLFAACELQRPTVGREILANRQLGAQQAVKRSPFFLTLFAGTSLKSPTLAEEFIDLRELIGTGLLAPNDLEGAVYQVLHNDQSYASFTLFGGFSECELPSENEEIEALALQRHLGTIPEQAGTMLQYGIGARDSQRYASVQRAVQAALT